MTRAPLGSDRLLEARRFNVKFVVRKAEKKGGLKLVARVIAGRHDSNPHLCKGVQLEQQARAGALTTV